MRLVLLGAPGSGKGTQAARLATRFGLEHISTGAVFRDEVERRTPLGLVISETVRGGLLVDDATVNMVVFGRLNGSERFLLDGYPRNRGQAGSLDGFLEGRFPLTGVLFLDVPDGEVARRLGGRISCRECGGLGTGEPGDACPACGGPMDRREDDSPAVVARRLSEYRTATAPLLEYYAGRLLRIDGTGGVDEVWNRVSTAVAGWE
jgi:adenylate kinase